MNLSKTSAEFPPNTTPRRIVVQTPAGDVVVEGWVGRRVVPRRLVEYEREDFLGRRYKVRVWVKAK